MSKPKKLIFFGNERLATGVSTEAPLLNALIDNGYEIAAVVSHNSEGRSRRERPLEIAEISEKHGIPLLLPEKPMEIIEELKGFEADAAVLAAYGRIIPAGLISIFPVGIINIHPSLLPAYRGPTPIETVMLDGATETGVSLMLLAPEMDAGPVFTQKALKIAPNSSKQGLADSLSTAGKDLMIENLPAILSGQLKPLAQDSSKATYTQLIKKADGQLDTSQPVEVLERQVRAYAGWPRSHTEVFGQKIIVTKARVAEKPEDNTLTIACQPGFLEIEELIAPSGKYLDGAQFLRGYSKQH